MQPTLLCMGMDPNQLMRVYFDAAALGVRVKAVGESDWGQTVGALCGLEPMNPSPQKASVDEAMIVMAFFDDALTDSMLRTLRESGQGVRLKAVLTPTNRHWTCSQLYRQLSQEAARMGR